MDEENREQEQKQNVVGDLAKQQAKQVANQAANQVKQAAKQELKKKMAELWAKIAVRIAPAVGIALLVIFAIITIIILLTAIEDYIDQQNAQSIDEVTYQTLEEYCVIDETGIHLNKEEFLKNLVIRLNENDSIDLNALDLGDDGGYTVNGNNIKSFDPNSQAAKYLYKFLSASLAGELPYIEGSDEETQGIIKIKRRKSQNEEAKDLTYIGHQQFEEMLKSNDSKVKEEIMNYFSLDESWNLCITKPYKKTVNTYSHGELRSSVTEYTISEVKIPYRTMVAQYTVPFLFLIDLQMVTHNANYVEAVAELMTKQSFIDFTIFDQITTNTNEYNYKATRHGWEPKEVMTSGETVQGVSRTEWVSYEHDIDETTETIIVTDNVKANVTKAKTWIIEQETNYEMQISKEYPYGENGTTRDLPDEGDPGGHGSWDTSRKEYLYTEIIKEEWMKSGDTRTVITPSEFMGLWANETGTYVKGAPYRAVRIRKSWKNGEIPKIK